MTVEINKEHLKNIIEAWNAYEVSREHSDLWEPPTYKGLSIAFKADEWRADRPQEFPQFCKFKKEHPRTTQRYYDCREWYLPESIIKMALEHEVTYEEIEAFITLLLKKLDTTNRQAILPLP